MQVGDIISGRGNTDLYAAFAQRAWQVARRGGMIGCVLPGAFHCSERATGIRNLYLHQTAIQRCYSFDNRRRLFEIHGSFKFDLIVACAGSQTSQFRCAFYLYDDAWLFSEHRIQELSYDLQFIQRTGGPYTAFIELQSSLDLEVAEKSAAGSSTLLEVCRDSTVELSVQADMTRDARRFRSVNDFVPQDVDPREQTQRDQLLTRGSLLLHEGKTFHIFTDLWNDRPRYLVPLSELQERPGWLTRARHFRLAYLEQDLPLIQAMFSQVHGCRERPLKQAKD